MRLWENKKAGLFCIAETAHQANMLADFEGRAWVGETGEDADWQMVDGYEQLTAALYYKTFAATLAIGDPGLIQLARA